MRTSARTRTWLVVAGTRPEAIKLAPLVLERRRRGGKVMICSTGQHAALLDRAWADFGLAPDFNLAVMTSGQPLTTAAARILLALERLLRRRAPGLLIVQGDTTTTLAAALAAYYGKIPVAHLEAGLRTHCKYSPFPEEQNRRLTGALADYHFAATVAGQRNLMAEGVPASRIWVTGNTGVDALRLMQARLTRVASQAKWTRWLEAGWNISADCPLVLATAHRRESFGPTLRGMVSALRQLALANPRIGFVFLVHPNPHVSAAAVSVLGRTPSSAARPPNLRLVAPLAYEPFVFLLSRACLVLTDSGGVQEEAATLGKSLLVMRNATERGEAIAAGLAELVGTCAKDIVRRAQARLNEELRARRQSSHAIATPALRSPFGDGFAAARIVDILEAAAVAAPAAAVPIAASLATAEFRRHRVARQGGWQ